VKSKKVLNAMENIDDKYIIEAEPGEDSAKSPAKTRTIVYYAARIVPIAACIAIIVAVIITWPKTIAENSGYNVYITRHYNTPGPSSGEYETRIIINELTTDPTTITNEVNYLWDYAIKYTPEEIQVYYGTNIFLSVLPDNFREGPIADQSGWDGEYYVFTQPTPAAIYYDENYFYYASEEQAEHIEQYGGCDPALPSITVIVSKAQAIFLDLQIDFQLEAEPFESSLLNGHKLNLYSFTDPNSYGVHYIATFGKDYVHFLIQANLISESEFIDVLAAFLEK